MIEMGIIVGIALLMSLAKMNWRWKLRVLAHPFIVDALVFLALLAVHWGTFSGVMVATIGAFACSVVFSIGRWLVGYASSKSYTPGVFDMGHKIGV